MMLSRNQLLVICLCLLEGASAFVVPQPSPLSSSLTTQALHQQHESTTELAAFSRRREIFGKLKKAVLAGGVASIFGRSSPALAEDAVTPATPTGRVVELQIANVGGEVGKSGTVKIQLHPEWAPLGVKRFEVST